MFPFAMPWNDSSQTVVSLTERLHKPAGVHGTITVRDGHLYAGAERIRLLGMNFSFSAALPASGLDAEAIAARLAKFGINAVRLTLLDGRPAPEGILKADMRTLDEQAMDRLDYFVHQLKRNGIYVVLSLHTIRNYPGLPNSPDMPLHHGGVDNFHAEAIAQQKEYARALLEHHNPYTNMRYAQEPSVALIEINNENALSARWWDGSLDRAPAIYLDDLERQWNRWLSTRYRDSNALAQSWRANTERAELLANGDFRAGNSNWRLSISAPSAANLAITQLSPETKPTAHISVTRGGQKVHDVQLYQEPLDISAGSSYTLTFDARTDSDQPIIVSLYDPISSRLLHREKLPPSAEWQKYRAILSPESSSRTARLVITGFGGKPGFIRLSSISLRSGGANGYSAGMQLGAIPRLQRKDFGAWAGKIQEDWLAFLADTETRYWNEMYRFIRNEIGARSLILGTQQSYSPYFSQAGMDVVDMHAYWDTQKSLGSGIFEMHNRPQVGDRHGGIIGTAAHRRVQGKPFIVSEYNYRAANTFATEADLLVLAYALFQDWDGAFIFNYANNDHFAVDRLIGDEGFNGHANRFVSLAPAALMFHRADITPSRQPLVATAGREALLNAMRKNGPAPPLYSLGLDFLEPLRHGVALRLSTEPAVFKPAPALPAIQPDSVIVSDTDELRWEPGKGENRGVFLATSPRTRIYAGFAAGREFELGNIRIKPDITLQDWASIAVTSLDNKEISHSHKLLLTATGMSYNEGARFMDAGRTRFTWGDGPLLVEGINARITLPPGNTAFRAWALDERGAPKSEVPVTKDGGRAQIEISDRYRTVWYLVEKE